MSVAIICMASETDRTFFGGVGRDNQSRFLTSRSNHAFSHFLVWIFNHFVHLRHQANTITKKKKGGSCLSFNFSDLKSLKSRIYHRLLFFKLTD